MKEKISVLIPTYNVGKFVEKAIRSVMQQSYTNLEIIVVDDFSTDDTFSILQKLANEDSRIKLFRNKQNMKPFFYKRKRYNFKRRNLSRKF